MNCRYLTYDDRKSIEALYASGVSLTDIASELGVHLATIYRELTRGGTGELDDNGRCRYSAELAQKTVQNNIKRRGHRKLAKVAKLTEKLQPCSAVPIDVMKQAFSECLDAFRHSNNKEE